MNELKDRGVEDVLIAIVSLTKKEWKMAAREWLMAKAQLAIIFEGRFRLA